MFGAVGTGPFERIGVPTTVPLLAGFLAACVVQVVGGVLLLWPRRSGIVVSVVGMLLSAPFWWGFDLPFAWLNAAVVLIFLALASTAQKGSSRSPSGGGRSSVSGRRSG
jgi:membrane protein implicated in regulation of membrane protease activity